MDTSKAGSPSANAMIAPLSKPAPWDVEVGVVVEVGGNVWSDVPAVVVLGAKVCMMELSVA
jgi:hypothetical protein